MVVFITGISSGFGLETAKLLAQQGHCVYGTVRRNIEQIKGIHYFTVDVRDADAVEKAVSDIVAHEGHIDVLVNNAGIGIGGPIEYAIPEDVQLQMETNFTGLVHCVKATLPVMRQQGHGKIIAISSIGGLMGLPFQGFYSASKFAIEGYCESLRLEIRQFGIHVVVVRPGDFSTLFTASRKKTSNAAIQQIYPAYTRAMDKIEHDENGGIKPIVLAKKLGNIIVKEHPRNGYVVASFEQKLSVVLKHIFPSKTFSRILSSYYKL